jgi:hypothetical protein
MYQYIAPNLGMYRYIGETFGMHRYIGPNLGTYRHISVNFGMCRYFGPNLGTYRHVGVNLGTCRHIGESLNNVRSRYPVFLLPTWSLDLSRCGPSVSAVSFLCVGGFFMCWLQYESHFAVATACLRNNQLYPASVTVSCCELAVAVRVLSVPRSCSP